MVNAAAGEKLQVDESNRNLKLYERYSELKFSSVDDREMATAVGCATGERTAARA